MEMLAEVLNQIERRQRFLLTSHARPDGDAIGSVLACVQILRSMGKDADVVLHDGVPHIYKPLPFADSVIKSPHAPAEYEAAIILECDSVARTRLTGLERHFLINIDHHETASNFADLNWIEPDACATAEMIFRLAREAGVRISPEIATCLYTAVLTDTGSFCFLGTNDSTFALAEELVRAGADPVKIAQSVYFSNPMAKMLLLGSALSRLRREGPIVWMDITREDMRRTNACDEDTEGLVNYSLAIEGVQVAVFFREQEDGRYRVSLRSKGGLNVARVAENFGGGGHTCASGFSIEGPLHSAIERVLPHLRPGGMPATRNYSKG
jgi:bifunctional oligoribonuclease and PAP phosphatase NrnA